MLAFGKRADLPVVVKVVDEAGDEWHSADVLAAFEGRGVVRVYDSSDGALLLERLSPGVSAANLALAGEDEKATMALAGVIARMSARAAHPDVPRAQDRLADFERHDSSGDARIPQHLARQAHRVYATLCESQTRPRLLHGDLHHYNVLLDDGRGWLAIDPKGVIAEPEYEVGAALRNPSERLDAFTDPTTIRNRVAIFARELGLDPDRMLAWAFAQAVLSVIWLLEDGEQVDPAHPTLVLADVLRPMLRE